jgi:hypothetical protein
MTTIVRVLAVMALMLMASLAQAQNKVPEALVKTTLLTFNDANVTGNYEVFHAKLFRPGLHPVGRRMEFDSNQRQGGFAAVTMLRQHHLTLRSARSARLEGWATPRLWPTLRDAALRAAPQGEASL